MKKIIFLCAAAFLLSGCQMQANPDSPPQGSPTSSGNESQSKANNSVNKDKSELEQNGFQKNMNASDLLRLPTVCKTENGYYLQNEGFLYFLDHSLGRMIIVCGRPECAHNDDDCNAWINSKLLSYYNGKLYYVNSDSIHDSYATLCSMNLDGTSHTDVQVIQIAEPGARINCAKPIFANGILYFMEPDHSIYRVSLGQKVENAVMLIDKEEETALESSAWKFWADGENAYAMNHYMDHNGNEHDSLYLLGDSMQSTQNIWSSTQILNSTSADASWYILNGQLYYYASGNEIWNIDLSTGNSEKISLAGNISGGTALFTDENAIILKKDGTEIAVCDYRGINKAKISLSSIYQTHSDIVGCDLVFGDGGTVFLLAYHQVPNSPSSSLYEIDWANGLLRELDTWPASHIDFHQEGPTQWMQTEF